MRLPSTLGSGYTKAKEKEPCAICRVGFVVRLENKIKKRSTLCCFGDLCKSAHNTAKIEFANALIHSGTAERRKT